MDLVSATFRNDFLYIADKSFDCIRCGLCAARCPADIAPYNLFLFVRRLVGRHMTPLSQDIARRIEEINAGKFEAELDRLIASDKEEIENVFQGSQAAH